MRTCLRGISQEKRDFLEQLREIFGCTSSFTYRESAGVANFTHRSFLALSHDGWIRKDGRGLPQRWKIACPEQSHRPNSDLIQ